MAPSRTDRVLRAVAIVLALAAVLIVTITPNLPQNRDAAARTARNNDPATLREEAAAAKTRGYAYLLKSGEHRYPARWCPGNINFYVDATEVAGAGMDPHDELRRWREVFDEWARQSGGKYTFTYAGLRGLTTKADGQLDIDSIEPGSIGITFVHGDSTDVGRGYDAAAVAGRTAGNGGLQVLSYGASESGAMVGDRGFVMIDVDDASRLAEDGLRRTLYQHESGHALGLGHVNDSNEIMNGTLSSSRLGVGKGDQAGLRTLVDMPCEKG